MTKKILTIVLVIALLFVISGCTKSKEYKKDLPVLMKIERFYEGEFWEYKADIKTITLQQKINIPLDAYKSWDVSEKKDGSVMAYIKPNSSDQNLYDLYIQSEGQIYANEDSSYLFSGFVDLTALNNIEYLNTSKVKNMEGMFSYTAVNNKKFTLDLGENFDTSNVTNMGNMFERLGGEDFTLDLGDSFDTSKVTDMHMMFSLLGYDSLFLTLNLRDKFDTSNVTDMSLMFQSAGGDAEYFVIDLGDKFDTSKVTNMYGMFSDAGSNAIGFDIEFGDKFDTSNVTNVSSMFYRTGRFSKKFKIDCRNWDFNKVQEYDNFNTAVQSKVLAPAWLNSKK